MIDRGSYAWKLVKGVDRQGFAGNVGVDQTAGLVGQQDIAIAQ